MKFVDDDDDDDDDVEYKLAVLVFKSMRRQTTLYLAEECQLITGSSLFNVNICIVAMIRTTEV